jgi:hypothetical protein
MLEEASESASVIKEAEDESDCRSTIIEPVPNKE